MSGINLPFMKRAYQIIIAIQLLAAVNSFAQSFDATVLQKSVKDRVLEVPKMEAVKTLSIFTQRINQMNDVSFEGFCESRRLLFLKASDEAFALVGEELLKMNMTYFIKKGASLQQAKRACDNQSEIENSLIITE